MLDLKRKRKRKKERLLLDYQIIKNILLVVNNNLCKLNKNRLQIKIFLYYFLKEFTKFINLINLF